MSLSSVPAHAVVTVDGIHTAILDTLRDRFGALIAQYGLYQPWDAVLEESEPQLHTPALLLAIEGLTLPETERPDPLGRLRVTLSLAVHCALSLKSERVQESLAQLAATVAAVVYPPGRNLRGVERGNQWGLSAAAESPLPPTAAPEGESIGFHGLDSWVVRWDQDFWLEERFPL